MDTKNEARGRVKCPVFAEMLAEVYAAYELENTAKDKAYWFILDSGLLDKFTEWSRTHAEEEDPHGRCVEVLAEMAGAGADGDGKD